MSVVRMLADHEQTGSLAARIRHKRFAFFQDLLARIPRPITLLDVGGDEGFWIRMGLTESSVIRITLLNTYKQATRLANVTSVEGDARGMPEFADGSFDVVFSNSVIEHLGTLEDQGKMADEIRRLSRRYFVQTPNRYFPVEPHFLFPFFQFLPRSLGVWIASHCPVGWYCHVHDPAAARREVEAIRLLSQRELRQFFPEARLYRERLFGLTKSFVMYHGWEREDRIVQPQVERLPGAR